MMRKGLLVDYQWCTGCHSCEIACQMEHGLPVGQFGIKVCEVGPWEFGDGKWQYTYIPALTDQCTLCGTRQAKGKLPTCVKHCQSQCIRLVDAEEASAALANKPKQLFMTI
ncbi:MAG: oxidoreductase [Coriobacteriia bacterium]|nr:oxidoreductase [Coriobacteriia bacterium]